VPPQIGLQIDGPAAQMDESTESTAEPGEADPAPLTRPAPAPTASPAPDYFSPLLSQVPFWLVDPPEPALLQTRRKGGRAVLTLGAGKSRRARRDLRVVHHGGPWKLVDPTCLTAAEPIIRDYYQVEAEDGRAYLVFWDRVADTWFLQGIFD
jgi:hypothetical protein